LDCTRIIRAIVFGLSVFCWDSVIAPTTEKVAESGAHTTADKGTHSGTSDSAYDRPAAAAKRAYIGKHKRPDSSPNRRSTTSSDCAANQTAYTSSNQPAGQSAQEWLASLYAYWLPISVV
jgi:hypothetical protein